MSIEKVRAAFAAQGIADRIRELDESSATVALAAQALGCESGRIAKTLSFQGKEQPMLIVAAGDGKIDNHRFKERFGVKAKMLASEEVPEKIGHAVGGVCPFAVNGALRSIWMTRCAALRRCSPRAAAATAPLS